MRKVTWIRFGVAVSLATIGVAGALAAGCSDDEITNPPAKDSGTDAPKADTGPVADTGTDGSKPDGGADADAAPPAPIVKLIIAHAAPGFGLSDSTDKSSRAFRMCFGVSLGGAAPQVQQLQALPDTPNPGSTDPPGVYPGTGGALPQFPIDPSGIAITPFLVRADKIKNETSADAGGQANCQALLGSDGAGTATLVKDTDFFQLATVPAGTFTPGHTYFLGFVGCAKGKGTGAGVVALCGSDYDDAKGNLQVGIATLDNKDPAPDSGIGVQFAHRSSATQGTAFGANGLVMGYVGQTLVPPPPFDAGPDADPDAAAPDAAPVPVPIVVPLTGPEKFGATQIGPATAAATKMPLSPATTLGFFVPNPDGGAPNPAPLSQGGSGVIALPLALIHQLSLGAPPGDAGLMFGDGHSYTFVLLGDPSPSTSQLGAADGGYDGRGLHIIAFPSDPVTKPL